MHTNLQILKNKAYINVGNTFFVVTLGKEEDNIRDYANSIAKPNNNDKDMINIKIFSRENTYDPM